MSSNICFSKSNPPTKVNQDKQTAGPPVISWNIVGWKTTGDRPPHTRTLVGNINEDREYLTPHQQDSSAEGGGRWGSGP